MLKGVEKQVIILKNTESRLFEQAIFILKDSTHISEKDLLSECEKIIRNNTIKKSNTIKDKNRNKLLCFISVLILIIISTSIILLINLL